MDAHHLRSLALAGILGAAATGCGSTPGRIVPLNIAAAPPSAASIVAIPQSPTPQSPPDPAGDAGIGFLRSVITNLNANTAATARGEYAVLGTLGDALRDRIESLLRNPPRG